MDAGVGARRRELRPASVCVETGKSDDIARGQTLRHRTRRHLTLDQKSPTVRVVRRSREAQSEDVVGQNDPGELDGQEFRRSCGEERTDVREVVSTTHEIEGFAEERCNARDVDSITSQYQMSMFTHGCPMAREQSHR
jgi:hypothetical protein